MDVEPERDLGIIVLEQEEGATKLGSIGISSGLRGYDKGLKKAGN